MKRINLTHLIGSWLKNSTAVLKENAVFYLIALLAAFALKYHYSSADAGELRWILTPVAHMVSVLSGLNFEWAAGSGFVNHSRGVVIAPACAGINFFIICFATIFFTFVARLKNVPGKLSWFALSVSIAFILTICANTARIILSIYLYSAPIYGGWVTPERVHQLAGIFIYVVTLFVVFLAIERMLVRFMRSQVKIGAATARRDADVPVSAAILLVPLAWYGAVTVVVPLLNGSVRRYGDGFMEHSVMVMITCACLFMISVRILSHKKKTVDRLNKTKEKG